MKTQFWPNAFILGFACIIIAEIFLGQGLLMFGMSCVFVVLGVLFIGYGIKLKRLRGRGIQETSKLLD